MVSIAVEEVSSPWVSGIKSYKNNLFRRYSRKAALRAGCSGEGPLSFVHLCL